jgi:hypothetical protein
MEVGRATTMADIRAALKRQGMEISNLKKAAPFYFAIDGNGIGPIPRNLTKVARG